MLVAGESADILKDRLLTRTLRYACFCSMAVYASIRKRSVESPKPVFTVGLAARISAILAAENCIAIAFRHACLYQAMTDWIDALIEQFDRQRRRIRVLLSKACWNVHNYFDVAVTNQKPRQVRDRPLIVRSTNGCLLV